MENSFIPGDYTVPTSGGGYTKLTTGENRLRILSSPLMVWVSWTDGKPKRDLYFVDGRTSEKPAKSPGEKDSVKHAWNMVVWNYNTKSIEIFELDKQTVIIALKTYAKDPDWGHPNKYDVVITKTGSGMDTEYSFIAKPAKPVSSEILEEFQKTYVNMSALLTNGDPFTRPEQKTADNFEVTNPDELDI